MNASPNSINGSTCEEYGGQVDADEQEHMEFDI